MRSTGWRPHDTSALWVGVVLVVVGLLLAALGPAALVAALEAVGRVGPALG